ncbi:MAG: deoxynucleoside kinase [Clostridia bacterium]|nr:deoxynucleoside kinase [Clostridia bacterium]
MPLIVIEGLDGSGKGTQSKLLYDFLKKNYGDIFTVRFPDYESDSSALVKMYLSGEFGKNADDVNAYAASSFYAVDRFASYNTKWKNIYKSGAIVLADRYTTSNIVYQLSKLPKEEWEEYINWAEDFEYNKLRLPRPDIVIYIDMPVEVSQKLMTGRYEGDESKKDIHESNVEFLNHCRKSGLYAAAKLNWKVIPASKDNEPRPIGDIYDDIKEIVTKALK